MARFRALMVAAILLAGCQGSRPAGPIDPFFGRTRIESPHTGAITGQPAVSPYNPGPPQIALPPSMKPLTQSTPGAESRPSLVFTEQPGDCIAVPAAAREMARPTAFAVASSVAETKPALAAEVSSPSSARVADNRGRVTSAGRQRIYQTIGPRSASGQGSVQTAASVAPSSRGSTSSGRTIDIMELPPPPAGAAAGQADRGIQLVSATEGLDDRPARSSSTASASSTPEAFAPALPYGCDPQYGWLRGRLEYSQIDGQWRLRYIPIDGDTDKYGGSVILTKTDLLSGYERGDFVEVHGKLGQVDPDSRSFAPSFKVEKILLLRK